MKTHNCYKIPEYRVWWGMFSRCKSTLDRDRKYYLDKGITVCERWSSFENFIQDMGRRPSPLHQLDRIDNSKNYEPGNCQWTTVKANSRNKSNTVRVLFEGESVPIADLADRFGINKQTIRNRLARGLTIEQALSIPVSKSNRSLTAFS